jgi:hypothetical protein
VASQLDFLLLIGFFIIQNAVVGAGLVTAPTTDYGNITIFLKKSNAS